MKISRYNKSFILKLLILLILLFITFRFFLVTYFCYCYYKLYLFEAKEDTLKSLYELQPDEPAPDFNYEGIYPIPYNEYYSMWHEYYIDCANAEYKEFQIFVVPTIIATTIIVIYIIYLSAYTKKINLIISNVKRYRDYMLATTNNKLEDIAKEFGENIETIEANIQKAIDKDILKNVYLSKQTKEVLVINKTSANRKVKGNVQNVNVENNLVVNTKGENEK